MYAVICAGGKQYKVRAGETLKVERLAATEGSTVEFDKVLLVEDSGRVTVGAPFIEGGRVSATVRSHGRHAKIKVVKFKRRKKYRRTQGHRQSFTEVAINSIDGANGSSTAVAEG
ncbi:MAG: 50S ribosomal protein L21 [Gammaproteobacteria bacterium]